MNGSAGGSQLTAISCPGLIFIQGDLQDDTCNAIICAWERVGHGDGIPLNLERNWWHVLGNDSQITSISSMLTHVNI
jgi:hypothetical protein